jgi:nucleoside-diphosphate-sugar epimerase
MEILLTGASGFLGKSIYNELISNNNVFTLSRTSGDFKLSLEKESPIFVNNFDLVIHAAGKAHTVGKSDLDKKEFELINILGTQNLLKSLDLIQVPKYFIFISSVAVYGIEQGHEVDETHELQANDPYGLSKIAAEILVYNWCIKNNVVCTILRLPLIIGPNPVGSFASMINGIKRGYYFNIRGVSAKKSMVLADDISKFILKVAHIGGVYNLTDGYHPSFNELSEKIALLVDKSKPRQIPYLLVNFMAKVGDFVGGFSPLNSKILTKMTFDLTFNDSKARKEAGWNPTPVLIGIKSINFL